MDVIMRFVSIGLVAFGLAACGGVTTIDTGDGGTKDAPNESEPVYCANAICNDYCIHPPTTTCATCTQAPDSGTCPSGSTLLTECPTGPALPNGPFCVSYPPPDPEYCSPTIPPECSFGASPPKPADVTCMPDLCGA
jgi:hypothetical protein